MDFTLGKGIKAVLCGVWMALLVSAASAGIFEAPPEVVDLERHYVVYLHGAILTGTDGTAASPTFGAYEYREILERFDRAGVEVISEIRENDNLPRCTERVIRWIRELKSRGVSSRRIAIVGASMGGIIAGRVSNQMRDPEITYVLIASLYRVTTLPPVVLSGRVMSIHDSADERVWVDNEYLADAPDLVASEVLVTHTGLGHGLLYKPNDAWFLPTIEWLEGTNAAETGP